MSIRNKTYKDYGMNNDDVKATLNKVLVLNNEQREKIKELFSEHIPQELIEYVCMSVFDGVIYKKLCAQGLDYDQIDFAAYKRVAVWLAYNYLSEI